MKKILTNTKGSVALISTLIISAILIIVVVGMAEAQISSSYQFLNSFSNKISYYTAESCLEEALVRIEKDTSFAGITLNSNEIDGTCIVSVSGSGIKDISISVSYQNYTQTFNGQVSVTTQGQANNITLLNWTET